ncbi:ferredoxin [Halalkaliarchaeum desulfuricum]|uniref:Ferredoxin n=1 Tax=Halalkaliarchaeum desulfuricum TaxID=2055893 RepID=A0A343TM37_9EURY|nr:ASKHA domain-containing protein [Halalkaliarchaeum desulfuricum]AUX10159.1 ferredoxin [Halalkaliarchaeum desulfuricum]
MAQEPVVSFSPWDIDVEAEAGRTVLEVADGSDARIEALCGGNGLCGTCAVQIESGAENLSSVTDEEQSVLTEAQLDDGYRLGCRAVVEGDVSVHVPASSRSEGEIVMTEGVEVDFDLDPSVRLYRLELAAPTLEDNTADRKRLFDALQEQYGIEVTSADRLATTELPSRIRAEETEGTLRCTAVVFGTEELLSVVPGTAQSAYGLAVDIGTTTVAVYLLDVRSGTVESVSSTLNPQRRHGGDIISRVQHSQKPGGREELQSEIVDTINESIDEVTTEAGIEPDEIFEAVFVGNTAMHHLFLGIDASAVAASPYVPAMQASETVKARELNVEINDSGYLSWLPIIGGWVGPDFVADLLAAGILDRTETVVCIDIGTNGEIAVYDGETAWTASAPAGPALEGAEISHGMRAKPGAIEAVTLDPDTWEPTLEVIDDAEPVGICGSGIVDVVAQLFLVGAIDRRGRFVTPEDGRGRVRETDDGDREFVLVEATEANGDSAIVVSQEDVRDIQNAKAAIQTGTNILLSEAGIDDVDRLVMAGGFGNYLDPESAKLLGMYPQVGADQVEFLGNAAGYGAIYALLEEAAKAEAERIVEEVDYVELAAWDGFHDEFMEAMYLPHRDLDRYPDVKARLEEVGVDRSL